MWGATGIAFTRLTARRNDFPTAEIWQMNSLGRPRASTHPRAHRPARQRPVPGRVLRRRTRLLARFSGQDTEEAWTLDLHGDHLHRLIVHGQPILPGAISRDGRTILGAAGDPLGPPSNQTVVTVPFGGGRATVLVRHAGSPSWTR